MKNPRYGENNQSLTKLEEKFMKTNSQDKSLGIDIDSFNWDDEEQHKGKINLGQYEENQNDEEDKYEDDEFENEEVISNRSTPNKSKSPTKNKPKNLVKKAEDKFTQEDELIMNKFEEADEEADEEEKMNTKQKQVKEINDLIEEATNFCLK
jgi:hypothetical protein